jgi:DNA-binding NtrC family response regulator
MPRILLIDDEPTFAEELRERLTRQGHQVLWQDTGEQALELLASGKAFDLILLDNKMPRMSGLEFLEAAGRRDVHSPVILMTSAHQDRTVIQAMNLGAFGYVIKLVDMDDFLHELLPVLAEALEVTRRPGKVPISPEPPADEPAEESVLIGRSRPMLDLLMRIGRLARLDESVMILGETGTGKDLVARALHTNSPCHQGPFVALNCTAFNEQLLDDELFGHEPGAFTGAVKLRKGRFEHAQGGTLFLDEAGDMPLPLQAKLLRVLENREIVRLGSNEPIRIDVRVLGATHCDLAARVRDGRFREDLFYRLVGLTIQLPPLRERKDDIELLARTFLARMFAGSSNRPALHPLALERLRDYSWPGNVRQLQKVLCRAAGVYRGGEILPEDIDFGELNRPGEPGPALTSAADPAAALRPWIEAAWESGRPDLWEHLQEEVQRQLLAFALARGDLSQVQLAQRLGVSRNHLRARLKHFGFTAPAEEE